ncbi:hypothetical protein H0H81_001423 [Sphagnurus paluster]|uniref:Uncharacterized protein n=1 Tax=Sphagnurus paluster TaxID=117069 RepID=A0A9P7KK31_9AGAR|nr:hypothetical protein H0H81_001423 [Sphagnurus paluster]
MEVVKSEDQIEPPSGDPIGSAPIRMRSPTPTKPDLSVQTEARVEISNAVHIETNAQPKIEMGSVSDVQRETNHSMGYVEPEEAVQVPSPLVPLEGVFQPGSPEKKLKNPSQSAPPPEPENIADSSIRSPPREPLADRHPETKMDVDPVENPVDLKRRDRSPSPPRHPRFRGPPPQQASAHPRRVSRSPPRGPRNQSTHYPPHSRSNGTPTGPASSYAPGPRGQRRQYPTHLPPTSLPSPPNPQQNIVQPLVVQEQPIATPPPAPEPEVAKLPLPPIPVKKLLTSLTPELDAEIARLQAHRAHLASEYIQLAKGTRRALHELDTATIDLRAAELRRKVADNQYERAKNAIIGVEYVPVDTSII